MKNTVVKSVCGYYFSGTDTTKKICETIGKKMAYLLNLPFESYNFSLPSIRKEKISLDKKIIVFGTPVIAGRVPNLFVNYIKSLKSKNSIGIAVVLYGNRNYDDALIELRDLMMGIGIQVIGCGAFIGEHSFSNELAKGRPNDDDLECAEKFAVSLYEKVVENRLEMGKIPKGMRYPYRKHYRPRDRYGNWIDIRKVKPITHKDKCVDCKKCVRICPMEAIEYHDVSIVSGICMKCCGCVKKCPQNAKEFADEGFKYHKNELEYKYKKNKKNQVFL